MERNRDELLGLLRSLGVELPRKTKLSDPELEKRLSKVLDSCQYITRVVACPPFDPTSYPMWNMNNNAVNAVRRQNFGEISFLYDSRMRGENDPFPLYVDAFMDLRQSLMTIAKNWDTQHDFMVFQDKDQISAITMRVLEVREFDLRTPVFIVIFAHDVRPAPKPETVAWISNYKITSNRADPVGMVTATPQEQQLLLQLLNQNSKRLVPSYKPKRADREGRFTLSFLLPIGPLSAKDIGVFNRNEGCSVCGAPAKSKCSRCGAIRYCSTVCQKEDWKIHRPTCTSLMGGTWRRLTFTSTSPPPGMHAFKINRFSNIFDTDPPLETDGENALQSPANTHGTTPFIVKVQLNSDTTSGAIWRLVESTPPDTPKVNMNETNMLIYDRQRTFEVHVFKNLLWPDADFDAAADAVRAKGELGLKVFLWAIRTGEWSIDLCLDHLPEWQKW